MPAGTRPVAGTDEPGSSSWARRRQSTAFANAWRTRASSNGGRVRVEPVVGHRQRRVAAERRAQRPVVGDPSGVDEADRGHVHLARHERVDGALRPGGWSASGPSRWPVSGPVVRVGREHERVRGRPATGRSRRCPRRLPGRVGSRRRRRRGRHDRERRAGHDRRQVTPAPLEVDDDAPVAVGRTPSVVTSVDRPLSRSRAPTTSAISDASGDGLPGREQAAPAVDDVGGRERRPVAEREPVAQGEHDAGAVVLDRPRLGEGRPDRQRGIDGGQRLVQLADVGGAAQVAVMGGIDRRRGAGEDGDRSAEAAVRAPAGRAARPAEPAAPARRTTIATTTRGPRPARPAAGEVREGGASGPGRGPPAAGQAGVGLRHRARGRAAVAVDPAALPAGVRRRWRAGRRSAGPGLAQVSLHHAPSGSDGSGRSRR